MDTADEKNAKRAAVESEYNGLRDTLEKDFVKDKRDLEDAFQADLNTNRLAKQQALVDVGLNQDGSDPQERPQDGIPTPEDPG